MTTSCSLHFRVTFQDFRPYVHWWLISRLEMWHTSEHNTHTHTLIVIPGALAHKKIKDCTLFHVLENHLKKDVYI
jgi:hypothetical protein